MTTKAKVILFANQKGGAAKSSNIVNLASAALFCGSSPVVILDCDPQRTVYLWQEDDRKERVANYGLVLPQVIQLPMDLKPSEVINALSDKVAEIWVDTAGFVGFTKETTQEYIEDILTVADVVVTPLMASVFDKRSTDQTMGWLDGLLSDMGRDIPRLLLRSKIKGGEKGLAYMSTLLDPILASHPKWSCMQAYIPDSTLFTKAIGDGGNAFVPRKIDRVANASIEAYSEIQVAMGVVSESDSRESMLDVLSKIKSIRQTAANEQAEEDAATND